MLALKLLQLADGIIRRPDGVMVGRWPRAAAALGRQSIESSLVAYWQQVEPSIAVSSKRAQLLSLPVYFPDEELAEQVYSTWASLSRVCHYHPYELPPTEPELRNMLAVAAEFANTVASERLS